MHFACAFSITYMLQQNTRSQIWFVTTFQQDYFGTSTRQGQFQLNWSKSCQIQIPQDLGGIWDWFPHGRGGVSEVSNSACPDLNFLFWRASETPHVEICQTIVHHFCLYSLQLILLPPWHHRILIPKTWPNPCFYTGETKTVVIEYSRPKQIDLVLPCPLFPQTAPPLVWNANAICIITPS